MACGDMERDGDPPPPSNVRKLDPRKKRTAGKAKPYERPRGGPARPVADLVPQIGRAAFRRFGFVQSSVVMRWTEIVGEHHAKVCQPESIRFPPKERSKGTLNLVVLPAHAPLIQHVIPEIIERVNRFFGYQAVEKVKMRQGSVQPRGGDGRTDRGGGATRTAPPSLRPIPMELGDSLRDIGDPELRTVLESLARSMGRGDRDENEDETN